MSKLTKSEEFTLFCLEAYKTNRQLSGEEVFNLFQECDIFSFLENAYDVLHTQSLDYIVSEIDKLIRVC